jgi:hypothetical protein
MSAPTPVILTAGSAARLLLAWVETLLVTLLSWDPRPLLALLGRPKEPKP